MNIAEILKDCPKGTKLYSPIFGGVYLLDFSKDGDIWVKDSDNSSIEFFKDGKYSKTGECLLFPSKENRDWSTFKVPRFKAGNWYLCVKDFYGKGVRFDKGSAYYCKLDGCLQEFDSGVHIDIDEILYDYFTLWTIKDAKDGDVLADDYGIYIFEKFDVRDKNFFVCNGAYQYSNKVFECEHMLCDTGVHPATKEQRDLLFSKMKEDGYIWDAEKLEPRKKEYEFKPFEKVLVREFDSDVWCISHFSHLDSENFISENGECWLQCIPYEGNEYLLGTTNNQKQI